MDKREIIIKDLKDQISTKGFQVKQKIKNIQIELLEELGNQNGNGIPLP